LDYEGKGPERRGAIGRLPGLVHCGGVCSQATATDAARRGARGPRR